MTGLDHSLLYQAKKMMNGANVHGLKLLIFAYETSVPGTRRTESERQLRKFVTNHTRICGARTFAEQARERSSDARAVSDALNREISNYLASSKEAENSPGWNEQTKQEL